MAKSFITISRMYIIKFWKHDSESRFKACTFIGFTFFNVLNVCYITADEQKVKSSSKLYVNAMYMCIFIGHYTTLLGMKKVFDIWSTVICHSRVRLLLSDAFK